VSAAPIETTPARSVDDLPAVMKAPEVAAFLRCDPSTVYELVDRGDLHAVRLGRVFRFTREEIARFVASEPARG